MEPEVTERFVDQEEKPIPSASTWEMLSVMQLYDVRSQLHDKIDKFRNVPQITKVLNTALGQLNRMLDARSTS